MTIDSKAYRALKDKAAKATQARDRAAGQLEGTMNRLEDEFGCEDLDAAVALGRKLKKQAATAEAAYEQAVADFEEAWPDELD